MEWSVHIDNDKPIVDDHLLEQHYKRWWIVIEVHQIVERWQIQLFVGIHAKGATKEKLSEVGELIEDKINEEKSVHDWLW